MNEQFFALPQEKQERILNAAMQVFSQNEYKRASTDDIAVKAGISKGLLFYYFHNKQALYCYALETMLERTKQSIADDHFGTITDFFELLDYAAEKKIKLITQMPYLMDFAMRAYFSQSEPVSNTVQQHTLGQTDSIYAVYFRNVDFSKFREGVEPVEVLKMLTWMTDGYLHDKRAGHEGITLETMMRDFRVWSRMFRAMAYKEEYQ